MVLIFGVLFINPQIYFNPFPPPTHPVLVLTNTPTPTPKGYLPATWTPTSSPTIIPTLTPIPSNTPEPTPEETPIPTLNLESDANFVLQEGSPIYETNTLRPEAGCNWLGVAGQVIDNSEAPVNGVLVEVTGLIGDTEISRLILTGGDFGDGNYEIDLLESPAASEETVFIQLLDHANEPLSEKISFRTYDTCDSNLIKINFEQVEGEE
jgi:hypothetical protein